jgi:nickel/cobalt exporter
MIGVPRPDGGRAPDRRGRRRRGRLIRAVVGALVLVLVPAVVSAHPLGNFTINHYAGLRIAPDRISVDLVIDEAEIPTFQERQRIDTDRDGTVSPTELETERLAACPRLATDVHLAVDGAVVALQPSAAGLSFLPGAGGLSTMRVVCELGGMLPARASTSAATTVTFEDDTFAERIGWREIVTLGDGTTLAGQDLLTASPSDRLTHYPTDLLTRPLSTRSVVVQATTGGAALAAWTPPDASPLAAASNPDSGTAQLSALGAIPGGIGSELGSIVNGGGLTPALLLGSLLVAIGLGAAHAISPGHGKTIMAAYLVGTRGTTRQAIGLGLAVTVSHTLGVLALAAITLVAASALPPERLYPILGVGSGALVVAIGGNLLVRRLQELRRARINGGSHWRAHDHDHDHGHSHSHGHPEGHQHPDSHMHPAGHDRPADAAGSTGEGAASTVSWRGLFALGLSGGLVPSASALILLLGSIAAGRVAYGVVLVVAFGAGMALVLGGVGIALVHASRLAARLPGAAILGRRWDLAQVAVAALVVVLGVALTGQALTQVL